MKARWKVYTDTGDWVVEAWSQEGARRIVMNNTMGRAKIECVVRA